MKKFIALSIAASIALTINAQQLQTGNFVNQAEPKGMQTVKDTVKMLYVAVDTSTIAVLNQNFEPTKVINREQVLWFYGYRVRRGSRLQYLDIQYKAIPKQYIVIRKIIL